jgi:hypothetical protein
MVHYPFGAGLGSGGPAYASPGASAFQQSANFDVEAEFSFLVVEVGIPGMLMVTGFLLALIFTGFRRLAAEPDAETRVWLAALTAPLVAMFFLFFASAVTPTVPIGPYMFAVGGIISYWLIELPAARARTAPVVAPLGLSGRVPRGEVTSA